MKLFFPQLQVINILFNYNSWKWATVVLSMALSYFLGCLRMLGFVAVPNLCASTGEYYYLIVIIIASSSHFTGNVGPSCPLFSLELCTLFSIVQYRVPGVSLLNWGIWAACHGVCAWGEPLYSLYIGAIDGNADEVTKVLCTPDDTRTEEPKERKFWKESLQ